MTDEKHYPALLNRYRARRNESEYLYSLMSTLPQHLEAFKTYKTMLSVGPGPGQYDMELMERSLPSLEHYTGVECDEYCCNELDKNLKARMGDKLKWKICKENMLTWKNESRFDVVMMSHCLYDLSKEERKGIFKTCLDKWLNKNGILLVLQRSNEVDADGKAQDTMQNLRTFFNRELHIEAEEILQEATEVGGTILFEQKFECQIDLSKYEDDLTFIFNINLHPLIDSVSLENAIQQMNLPKGLGRYFVKLALIGKA